MMSKLEKWAQKFYHIAHETKWRTVLLFLTVVFTIFFGSRLPGLSFNYDIESFFSNDDPEVALYDEYKSLFGNENNSLLIGIESESGIFRQLFLTHLDTLTQTLSTFSEVEKVISPTNLKEYVKMPLGGFQPISVLHVNSPKKHSADSSRIYQNQSYVGSLFSANRKSVSLILKLRPGLNHLQNETLLTRINDSLNRHGLAFSAYHLAGRIQTQHYYIKTMRNEMLVFSTLALLLFCGSIWLLFKQFQYVIVPLGVISVSLIWIFGMMSLLKIQVDLMLTILPSLIFILSTSVCIHFLSRFQKIFGAAKNKKHAIKQAFEETAVPNFLISVTTAGGFGSLYFIPVSSIQRLGLLASVGIIIALLLGHLLIPYLLKIIHLDSPKNSKRKNLTNRLSLFIIAFIGKVRGKIIFAYVLGGIVSLVGISLITINNKFLDDLEEKSILKQDLLFFEDEFSGIRPFELIIKGNGESHSLLNYENVKMLDSLEQFVSTTYKLGMIQSPVVLIKMLNKSIHGGDQNFFKIPDQEGAFAELMREADRYHLFQRFDNVYIPEYEVARISGRIVDAGRKFYHEKNQQLDTFLDGLVPRPKANLTGVAYLIDNANTHVTKSFMVGLAAVITIVILVISFYTLSVRLTVIALIVNLVPLFFMGALIGFLGISLKISTAMIFTIVLGISVDDTIHFLHRYISLQEQYPKKMAIKLSISQMSGPILFTSIVLFSGFMIFSLSSFESIQILGWMTGVSLIVAMLADFLLLPVMLLISGNREKN